jgi:protoheme IX farnesyltransferase
VNTGPEVKPVSVALPRAAGIGEYIELMKLRLVSLVLVTTAIGFYLGFAGAHDAAFFVRLVKTVLGTALLAGGAMALNQVMERDTDALMRRTRTRPLPEGRIEPLEAAVFGLVLVAVGAALLCWSVNVLTGVLGLFTAGVYLLLYTPLKRRTPLCTMVGAVSGAVPPMMGYTAAAGAITVQAWLLFTILFAWQMPHFLAIAWLYREDYTHGRQMMLPVVDPSGASTAWHMTSFALALLLVTLAPAALGMAGEAYFAAASVLGLAFVSFAVAVAVRRTNRAARAMFIVSVVYLPVLLTLMMMDRP